MAMPIDSDVRRIELNSRDMLAEEVGPEPGEVYRSVIIAPSIVSQSQFKFHLRKPIRHMPHVKTKGNNNNNQNDVPLVASTLAIPSNATSVLVSNPRPNRNPSGYIFHGRSINLKILLNSRVILPPIRRRISSFVSRWSGGSSFCARRTR